jgi:hypothetical protein
MVFTDFSLTKDNLYKIYYVFEQNPASSDSGSYLKIINDNIILNIAALKNALDIYAPKLVIKQNLTDLIASGNKENKPTNDRKSFYESQQYENLVSWYLRFIVFYYIISIIFIITLMISNAPLSFTYKIIISIGVILYPYLISHIIKPIIILYHFIYNLIPKNVYNNL